MPIPSIPDNPLIAQPAAADLPVPGAMLPAEIERRAEAVDEVHPEG
jgi:hypothetical protein